MLIENIYAIIMVRLSITFWPESKYSKDGNVDVCTV